MPYTHHPHHPRRLFPPLLTASLWERKANIPGLVLLMDAYLSKGADTLLQHMEPILGIFSSLVAFRASEKYAVDLLMSVFEHFPHEALARYERRLFEILLTRLQTSKNPRTVRLTIHFLAFYAGKLGPQPLVAVLEQVQPGMTQMLLQQVRACVPSGRAGAGVAKQDKTAHASLVRLFARSFVRLRLLLLIITTPQTTTTTPGRCGCPTRPCRPTRAARRPRRRWWA